MTIPNSHIKIDKYPYMGYSPNLINYFLLIGYDQSFISQYILKNIKSTSNHKSSSEPFNIYNIPIYPTILSSISSNITNNISMIDNNLIIKLSFPDPPSIIYTTNKYTPSPYNVIFGIYGDSSITEETNNNKQIYNGYTFVFYEEKIISNNLYVYVPKCFSFISQYPFFFLFNNICKDILKLFTNEIEIPIEIQLYNIINFTPSPINCNLKITLFPNQSITNLDNTTVKQSTNLSFQSYSLEQIKCYPIIDFNLSDILYLFKTSQLIELVLFSFLEIDMIFISTNMEMLTSVMYIISSLSYPCLDSSYLWHIITVSKKEMNLQSTNPFVGKTFTGMIGINGTYDNDLEYELINIYKMYFVIDLDNKNIDLKYEISDEEDNDEQYKTANDIKRLRCFISKICDDNKKYTSKFLEKSIHILDEQLKLAYKKVEYNHASLSLKTTNFYGNENTTKNLNLNIQEAFYNFILDILSEFYFFFSIKVEDQEKEINSSLNKSNSNTNNTINDESMSHNNANSVNDLSLIDDPTISCIEINESIAKTKLNYIMNYKENTKDYCNEEKILFNLFHITDKYIRFIKEFIPEHISVNIYKIPLLFTEEFILLKHILKDNFTSHFFDIINMFYSYNIKSHKEKITFDNFYKVYNNELKSFYQEELLYHSNINSLIHTRQNVNFSTFKYNTCELDNNLIIKYALYISNMSKDEIRNLFPSQNVIDDNIIKKVDMNLITNSIQKELFFLKIITPENLLIYSLLLLICFNLEIIVDYDIEELLQFIPHDLLNIRKYLTILIECLYKKVFHKWENYKNDQSILKEIFAYFKWIKKITRFLFNNAKILPNENLSFLMENIFSLESEINSKYPNFANMNENKEDINANSEYKITLFKQKCLCCGEHNTSNINNVIQLSYNIEYDGCFYLCDKEECNKRKKKQFHKLKFDYMNENIEKNVKVYSLLKIYNKCEKMGKNCLMESKEQVINEKVLDTILINLMFYFETYEVFKNNHKWVGEVLCQCISNKNK